MSVNMEKEQVRLGYEHFDIYVVTSDDHLAANWADLDLNVYDAQ